MNQKKGLSGPAPVLLLLSCAAVFFLAAVQLGERIPEGICGLLWAAGGVCGGFGTTGLASALSRKKRTPEQLREMEVAQNDERNAAIRDKAGYDSWRWTTWLLWGAFFIAVVTNGGFYVALISAVIVLHCVFYIVNLRRWANRM